MPLDQCRKVGGRRERISHSFLSHWSEPHRCFHDESCLLSDEPYLLCESCFFCPDQSPGGGRYSKPSTHLEKSAVCFHICRLCIHLITLHRAFPVEANHMRQAFAAAAAAPHGGHVIVKERTVICSDIIKNELLWLTFSTTQHARGHYFNQ